MSAGHGSSAGCPSPRPPVRPAAAAAARAASVAISSVTRPRSGTGAGLPGGSVPDWLKNTNVGISDVFSSLMSGVLGSVPVAALDRKNQKASSIRNGPRSA